MAGVRRRNLLESRRRVPDEDEDEDSALVNAGDDSLSDGSIPSEADDNLADNSDLSEPDGNTVGPRSEAAQAAAHKKRSERRRKRDTPSRAKQSGPVQESRPAFVHNADTDAMANGIKPSEGAAEEDAVDFENSTCLGGRSAVPENIPSGPKTQPGRRVGPHEGGRGDEDQPKDRASDPAAVPNRGGFFMHDQRNDGFGRGGYGASGRGRGRGRLNGPGSQAAFISAHEDNTAARWTHDLHESVENSNSGAIGERSQTAQAQTSTRPASMSALLSKTVSIGTVTARVYLPLMKAPINFERMPVKQHTRLPDLRPPLRRDKPVRISLPLNPPRYIFPSTERSFIFIPRAQRPNQQSGRGRGRGYVSQQGSRRQSLHGGSNYTPSVAMSRRSSFARDGLVSPTGSVRPVVKLPFNIPAGQYAAAYQPTMIAPNGMAINAAPYPLPSQPTFRGAQSQIPMHQPRPQKAVSVATIESPNPNAFQAPQQQEQQPFHQQVPQHVGGGHSHVRHMSFHSQASGNTPLSNIPERAINAQPFQPTSMQPAYAQYPAYQGMYYYPMTEGPAQASYVQAGTQGGYYVPVMGGPAGPAASEAATQQQQQQQQQAQAHQPYAHEANGMVYFYDPSQLTGSSMEGAGGLHTPAPEGYWQAAGPPPPMMYYPTH